MEKNLIREEDVRPDVSPFRFYVNAFSEISTCRNGMSPQIPFTAIVEYARIYEVEDMEEFIYLIREMDNEYISVDSSKKENNGPSKASKGN